MQHPPRFDEQSILVVGGAGFVGANLVKKLLERGASHVHVIDNLMSAEAFNLPQDERVRFTHQSITHDPTLQVLEDTYNHIFHLATYHGNQSSIHDPLADHENNTLTTLKLFERIKDFKQLKSLVYSGAGCCVAEKTFGEAQATVESDLVSLNMDSPYSISKVIGEFYAKYYHKQHNLPVVRVRFQNVYGPGEVLGAGQWRGTPATVWRNVTPTFVFKALKQQPLPVENGGIATRDFIYVDDITEGLICAASRGKAGDVYNLASGVETTILDLANLINELTDNPHRIEEKPKRDWDNSGKRYGSPEKAKAEIGFEAKTPLREGMAQTVQWTREHLPQIEATMAKHQDQLPDIKPLLKSLQPA